MIIIIVNLIIILKIYNLYPLKQFMRLYFISYH